MKRKVLIVLPELETGGGQRMAISIANEIKAPDLQIRILVLYPPKGDILESLADECGLDVQYLHKKSGVDLRCIVAIHQAIRAFQPDVIHAHLRVMPYLLLPMCLAGTKRRYYTVHNLAEKDAAGIRRRVLKFAFRRCRVQPVAISALCQQSLSETYGISKEKIPCIYGGIDVKRFSRPQTYPTAPPFRFAAVGRLSPQKNYPLMLQAFAEVHRRHPDTELFIMGDGELRPQLERQCEALGLGSSVCFTGNVPDVERYLWSAHAYLMSSDYEGVPLTVLEAMAAGLPILSTKAGGIVDVVEHLKNGLLTETGDQASLVDAMERLVQSPDLCKQFSDYSTMLARKYSIQACADQYQALYFK
jgi:glycosyltransferase involved in cell wall biosynthesis